MSAEIVAQRILWFLPALLQAGAALLMLRRKMHTELPMFFTFLVFKVGLNILMWPLRHHPPAYFYCYWIAEAIAAVLGFAIIYEVFTKVVKRYEAIHRVGFLLYRWIAVFLLVVAAITAATAPGMDSARIIEGILTLERGVRIVQVGLLFFLFIFASYLGLSWRNYIFGVALGLGIFASAELTLVAIRAHMGAAADPVYVWFKAIAYNCMTFTWAIYLLQRQPQAKEVTSLPKTEVAVWNQALMEFMRR